MCGILRFVALFGAGVVVGETSQAGEMPPAVETVAPASIVSFRDGELSAAEIDAWLELRPPRARLDAELGRRQRIEERVVLEVLERRFLDLELDRDPEALAWQRRLEQRMAVRALRQRVVADTVPAVESVRAAYEADPDRFDSPRRWRLRNILKRLPPDASATQRAELRRQVEALRARIVGGESFAEVAAAESDSTTRFRGGALGTTTLDRLDPSIAEVVGQLEVGELSAPLEIEEGITLLWCEAVVPEVKLSREQALEKVAREQRERLLEEEWARVTQSAVQLLSPSYRLLPVPGSGSDVVVLLREGKNDLSLTRLDLELYLREKRLTIEATTASDLRGLAEELVREVALRREADRRGITSAPEHRQRLRLETLEMRAELALRPALAALARSPSDEELRALWEQRRERFVEPPSYQLRLLELPIRQELPAELYRRFDALAAGLVARDLSLEEGLRQLSPHATIRELGWTTQSEVWHLGRGVEEVLKELEIGALSPPVQEGRKLLVVHLLDRRAEREMTFAEARPRLEAQVVHQAREGHRRRLRAEIVAEQQIRFDR